MRGKPQFDLLESIDAERIKGFLLRTRVSAVAISMRGSADDAALCVMRVCIPAHPHG